MQTIQLSLMLILVVVANSKLQCLQAAYQRKPNKNSSVCMNVILSFQQKSRIYKISLMSYQHQVIHIHMWVT